MAPLPAAVSAALIALPAHIALVDAEGVIRWTNPAWNEFARANGFQGSRFGVGDSYLQTCERTTGECRPQALEVAEGLRAVLAGRTHEFTLDYPCHSPTEQRWFQVSVTPVPGGGAALAHTNITRPKLAEASVRESEERFRTLMERSTDLLAVIDGQGRFTFVSPSSASALGSTPERVLGRNVFELLHPHDEPALRKLFAGLVSEPGGVRRVEFKMRHSNQSWRVLDTVLRNLTDFPSIAGIVANARDVTDERRLEAELAEARKMEALGRLAGGIAHEFNNLLTVIKGYSDLVLSDLDEASPLRSDVTAIAQAGERAASITRQLLQFARRHAASPVVLDVAASLRRLQSFLKPLLGENIATDFRVAPGLWPVHFDPAELEQVLMNLAVNARDAMPSGGRLVVEARNEPAGTCDRTDDVASAVMDQVVIAVSDDGIGMTDEVAEHVFEPFFTTKGPGRGTGLGLPTSLGIVEQHGGRIRFQTVPGRGTTFLLYIPRAAGAPTEPAIGEDVVPGGARELLLVVEDDPAVRNYTVQVLRKRGYEVCEACDGSEALAVAEQLPRSPDLLVTDVVMPDMSGAEVADMLARRWPGLRILFVSGYAAEASPIRELVGPEEAFLAKPYTPEKLASKVRALLDVPGPTP